MKNHNQTALMLILGPLLFLSALATTVNIPLPSGYHDFADIVSPQGSHGFFDFLSNIFFILSGLFIFRNGHAAKLLGIGLIATGCASGFYHLNPNDFGLFLDRAGMATAFAGMIMVMIDEIQNFTKSCLTKSWISLSILFMIPAYGAFITGNMSAWVFLQVSILIAIALSPLWAGKDTIWRALAAVLLYALAKVTEGADAQILEMTGIISGHTIKHIVAAGAPFAWVILSKHLNNVEKTKENVDNDESCMEGRA